MIIARHAMFCTVLLLSASTALGQGQSSSQSPPATPWPAVKPALPAAAPGEPETSAVAFIPTPRAKPKAPPPWPPLPREKPDAPFDVADARPAAAPVEAVAPASAVVPSAAVAPTAPIPSESSSENVLASCGNACTEILFQRIDECLWVLNMNPHPIAFEAQVGSGLIALKLEGANGPKADARLAVAADIKATAATTEAAYHIRLQDPFQSSGSGIPAYRVRLGGSPETCVKARNEIQRFSANYIR